MKKELSDRYEVNSNNVTVEMSNLESDIIGAFEKARTANLYRMGTERSPKHLMATRKEGETIWIHPDCTLRFKKS